MTKIELDEYFTANSRKINAMINRRTLSQIIFGGGEVFSVSQNKFVDLHDQNRGRIWLANEEFKQL